MSEEKVKENNSLMKKTKAELVNIILRKDERERELLKELESQKDFYAKDLEKTKNGYKYLINQYECLKNDYNNLCDDKVTDDIEYNNIIKTYKLFSIFLSVAVFIYILYKLIYLIV